MERIYTPEQVKAAGYTDTGLRIRGAFPSDAVYWCRTIIEHKDFSGQEVTVVRVGADVWGAFTRPRAIGRRVSWPRAAATEA